MNTVAVLIVVDALAAVASGDLQSNVYLIDTNKHFGSGSEGQAELRTAIKDGQIINWRLEAVDPNSDVAITGFTGQMVDGKVCVPVRQGIADDVYWAAMVQARGVAGEYQYSVVMSIDGKSMTFDPFLEVQVS